MLRNWLSTNITARPGSGTCAEIAKFGRAAELGGEAAAYAGVGLDLYGGECPLLSFRDRSEARGYTHTAVVTITNRRTIAGGFATAKGGLNELGFAFTHDDLHSFKLEKSFMHNRLAFNTPHGKRLIDFTHVAGDKKVVELYQQLAASPAGSRGEPPTAPLTPTDTDPTGALGAGAALWSGDASIANTLQTIATAARDGTYAVEHARDLAARMVLLDRSRLCGPASYGSAFLSPLCADDFGHALAHRLGAPAGYQQPQPGMHVLDFAVDRARGQLGPAMKALGIASFVGLGVGFSPGRMIAADMLAKPPLRSIRFVYGDVQGGCSYEIHGNGQPLHLNEGELAHGLHRLLIESAALMLPRRADVGWSTDAAALFA